MPRIVERFVGRENNFDAIRLIAALMVVLYHSYALNGILHADPLGRLTHGQDTFGGLGVNIFFVLSGFLIAASYERSGSLVRYLKARALRIFPGLFGVLVFSVFVLGPFVTPVPFARYFADPHTYSHLRCLSLYWLDYGIPGVFAANPNPGIVNGSLWTLAYEFDFYLLVAALGQLRLLRKDVVTLLYVASLASFHFSVGGGVVALFRYFGAGMLLYLFRDRVPINGMALAAALGALALGTWLGAWKYAFLIVGPYAVIALALTPLPWLRRLSRSGDLSYGLYIYGFPLQQALIAWRGPMRALETFALVLPLLFLCAAASWRWIERPCLKLKDTPLLRGFSRDPSVEGA